MCHVSLLCLETWVSNISAKSSQCSFASSFAGTLVLTLPLWLSRFTNYGSRANGLPPETSAVEKETRLDPYRTEVVLRYDFSA